MSPEQAQGQPLDHRSDIYSLGITCWHALAGKPPFTGETALAVALQHVNNSPPPLLKQRSGIPSALATVVERMIEKKPEDRFQTFHSILQELQVRGMVPDSAMLVQKSGLATMTARQVLQRALERRRTLFGRLVSMLLFVGVVSLLGWSSGYAYRTWINPPFAGAITQTVPKMSTVEDQWIYACFVGTPEAWHAVIDHFPDEAYFWGNKAKRQLIRHYYLLDDRHNSLPLFDEFAQLSEFYLEEQMLGLAGLLWCTAMDSPDIRIPQDFLDQIRMIPYLGFDDDLYWQILAAGIKRLQEREAESSPLVP
jgi:serine/threonine-protein kinase